MRRYRLAPAVMLLCAVSCGQHATAPPTSTPPPSGGPATVDPANVMRSRAELPLGYEFAPVSGPASPVAFWGFKPGWVTEPAECGALAGPAIDETTTRGWSGSGPGGIVHTVVAGSPTARVDFDPAIVDTCQRWTVASGNTTGTVDLVGAPVIDGAATVGMASVATTVVEGGTQTSSTASTFSAYLDGYLVFVTVVTDPGSASPPLGQDFAAELLVKTVSALRG
jgi:hypothetical protein